MTTLEPRTVRTPVSFEEMRDDVMLCRTVLHAWEEVVDDSLQRPEQSGWWWFVLRCVRCETTRLDLIDSNGDMFSRRYKYKDGYQLDEKITRSELRTEWARRHNYGVIPRRTRRKK